MIQLAKLWRFESVSPRVISYKNFNKEQGYPSYFGVTGVKVLKHPIFVMLLKTKERIWRAVVTIIR